MIDKQQLIRDLDKGDAREWAETAVGKLAPLFRRSHGGDAKAAAWAMVGACFYEAQLRGLRDRAKRQGDDATAADMEAHRLRSEQALNTALETLDGRNQRRARKILTVRVVDDGA